MSSNVSCDVNIGEQLRQEQTTVPRMEVKERACSVADGDNGGLLERKAQSEQIRFVIR